MGPRVVRRIACLLAGFTFFLFSLVAHAQDFTVVVLPDTQNYSQFYPDIFKAQTQWAVDNAAALNIKAVIGEGDIVNHAESATEWQNADAAVKILDQGAMPYALAIGNHDYEGEKPSSRSAIAFNQWFGPARYKNYSWYGGNYNGSNENFYTFFSVGGQQYMVLSLEFFPRATAISWASSVIDANPGAKVIVTTHSFVFTDGTRGDRCDTNDLPGDGNTPEALWTKLLSQKPNVILVVSGHLVATTAKHRMDLGANGNLVNQMFTNFQDQTNGGNGYLRILTFHPSQNSIDVKTYSPSQKAYKTDSENQFSVPITNDGNAAISGAISGKVRTPSCTLIAGAQVSTAGATATSDSSGRFTLSPLNPNLYDVSVTANGYNNQTQSQQKADAGYSQQTDFYLTAAPSGGGPCPLNPADPSVTICTPASNASVTSPVHVVAGTTSSTGVSYMQVYVDGVKTYQVNSSALDTNITMATGTRKLTVQAKNPAGTIFKQTIFITVGSTSPGVSVSVSPSTASISAGATQQFTANVSGTTNTAVSWFVDDVAGGGSTTGTISTSGLYTAPTTAGTHTVKAVSAADTTKSGSATVSVGSTPAVAVSVSPSSASIAASATQQFTANVSGTTNTAVSWFVDDVAGGNSTTGTVTTSGLYTAPTTAGTHTVKAVSAADTTKSGSATVNVGTPPAGCTATGSQVNICTPTANATVSSPVHIVAAASSTSAISFMQVYVDGVQQKTIYAKSIDTTVAMAAGTRRVTVQAKDTAGVIVKQTIYVTVQ